MTQHQQFAILLPLVVGAGAVVCTILVHALALAATVNFLRHERKLGHAGAGALIDLAIAALVLVMIGYVTWKDYDVAKREINVFAARATDAMKDEQFDRAMRYALPAYPARGSIPWFTPFSTELEGKLADGAQLSRLHRLLKSHTNAGFSPDGKRVVTA